MIWNLWWVRYAILRLHRSPFFTPLLHFPFGTPLWLHALTPFSGLLSIPLTTVLTPMQAFNVIVLLAYVGSGLTAFWLCWKATRAYWPSIAGGFAFECCSYRWAHYFGHLPLISTEAMPLFLLGLLSLLLRPRILSALGTAIALLTVLLFDQYQFLYCTLATVVVLIWWGCSGRLRKEWVRAHVTCFATLLVVSALTCGPIVLAMIHESTHPVTHSHDPEWYSADLLGPWVPDWTWVYGDWTRAVWGPSGMPLEKSVCIGPAVLIAAACIWLPRRRATRLALGSTSLFLLLAIVFVLFCFGPTWRFWDTPITGYTPYRLLSFVLPSLRVAGCPGRMIIMAQLAIAVLAAAGLSRIAQVQAARLRVALLFGFTIILIFEAQPRALLTCPPEVPHWVEALRDAPGHGAVIDLLTGDQLIGLYYQTVYQRPQATGDFFRLSVDTAAATDAVLKTVARGDYQKLTKMGFAYIVKNSSDPLLRLPVNYSDQAARIYALPPEVANADTQ